ncbi:hypothetical protein ACP4OV_030246 [Aristida adscensionis]
MGCAASADRAERRRRAQELGQSEASTAGLLEARQQEQDPESAAGGRRRGCKVAPEPEPSPAVATPGSPSFRHYCQNKTAAVDALVAEADDSDGSVGISGTPQPTKKNELTVANRHKSNEDTNTEVTRWLRFRGLAMVAAAWNNLFGRPSSKASPPPAAAAEKSDHPCPAPDPAAAARSHP